VTDINLTGKVAIVAGGGGGMGRAMALALVEKGAKVAVFDVRQENVDEVVEEAVAIGDSECAIPLVSDITKIDDCLSAVQETIDTFNSVDILVNAAGLGMATLKDDYWNDNLKFWNADIDRFNALMTVNWNGPYGPSKAALEAATSVWSKDLEGTGVTANVLVPGGPVNTDFIPENAPFDRTKLTQPEVMQAPICWLASDLSDGVTNMRFVARSWDSEASLEDAIRESGGPCAWPDAGKKAYKPT